MDLTGSISEITVPLSAEFGSIADSPTGSSAIDTILATIFSLPNLVLSVAAMAGADVGSTPGVLGAAVPMP